MSRSNDQNPDRRAYTGETVIMPVRRDRPRAPAPRQQWPRPARRRIWPAIRTALLVLFALALIGLVLLYVQVRSIAGQIVVRDARLNPPLASPLGSFNLLLVGVDARPDHPEEGVRGDTLIVVHLDSLGRWASTLAIPRDSRANIRGVGETKINVAYGQGYAAAEELFGSRVTIAADPDVPPERHVVSFEG